MTQSLLNTSPSCAKITVSLHEFNELVRRVETLEKIVIEGRRAALRQELAGLEDGMNLDRTVKRRVR
jgi:hypothetical protein